MNWAILLPIAALAILAARRWINRHINSYFDAFGHQDGDR